MGYKWGGYGVKLWLDGQDSCTNERHTYYELVSKPIRVSVQMHSLFAIRPPTCSANMLCPSLVLWWFICYLDTSDWRGDLHFSSQRFGGSYNVGLNPASPPGSIPAQNTSPRFQVRINLFLIFLYKTISGFDRRVY